mgnify:CR=1 FL=1
MSRSSSLVLIAVAAALLTPACGVGAHYGASSSIGTGSAYTPVGYSKSTTATIGYHEEGGLVSKAILTTLVALSAAPNTRTTRTTSTERTNHGSTTTTTTVVTDTPEQIAAKAARANAMLDALETSEIPFEFNFELAVPSLAGNTKGYMWSFMYASEPSVSGVMAVRVLAGFAGGKYKFSNLDRTSLIRSGASLVPLVEADQSYTYNYIGTPVRLEAGFSSGFMTYLQADLNFYSIDALTDQNEASPFRIGIGRNISILRLTGELEIDRWRSDGLTAQLGASLVL